MDIVVLQGKPRHGKNREKWGSDWRWIRQTNDPNFEILRRETIVS
jgi:hypothetical protein